MERRRLTGGGPSRRLHVLVVDDSALVRQVMAAVLEQDRAIEVTAAADPLIAMEKMKRRRPDVIVLDVEMPRMNGLAFLRRIMEKDPIPVVICSGHAARGTDAAFRALDAGAVDVVAKPQLGIRDFLYDSAIQLIGTVRAAADARVIQPPRKAGPLTGVAIPRSVSCGRSKRIAAIGASTGGTEALSALLGVMPPEAPALLVVQHMPCGFTETFARRLNASSRMVVKEAVHGETVRTGYAFIAPGGRHLRLRLKGAGYVVDVSDGPLVSRHRPSVDVLFHSVAEVAGPEAVGVILTGMGTDGAEGLLAMKQRGAATIAQDEASSVVFGMAREAIARGAVDHVVPLGRLAQTLLRACEESELSASARARS